MLVIYSSSGLKPAQHNLTLDVFGCTFFVDRNCLRSWNGCVLVDLCAAPLYSVFLPALRLGGGTTCTDSALRKKPQIRWTTLLDINHNKTIPSSFTPSAFWHAFFMICRPYLAGVTIVGRH